MPGIDAPLDFQQQIVTPSWAPASTRSQLYFKSDGLLYRRGADGVEYPVDTTGGGGTVPSSMEVGGIMGWPGANAPAGWLLCQGQAVSRSTYPDLFGVCGTTFGAGDGSTTFNVPDLRGRTPIGTSATHALASQGGAETHTLQVAEMPAHRHSAPANFYYFSGTGGANTVPAGTAINATTDTTTDTGGGQPHNNMQPFTTVNWIIKALPGGGTGAGPITGTGGMADTFNGPWPATAATPTSGRPYNLPAGILRCTCQMTCWAPNTNGIAVDVYLDGAVQGTAVLNASAPSGLRVTLPPVAFQQSIAAGTHYVYYRLSAGSGDAQDRGSVFGTVTPN